MKTVYFDHNVLIKVCEHEGVPPSGILGELVSSGVVKPVFSPWHWTEAARMQSLAEAARLARLLDWPAGYWLPDRISIMLGELAYALGRTPNPPGFFSSPREAIADLTHPSVRYLLIDSVTIVQRWKTHPGALSRAYAAYRLNRSAFLKNVRDYRMGKLTPEKERRMILRAVLLLAQKHGVPLTRDELDQLDFRKMLALCAEVALAKIRWGRGGRFRWQHFVDNAHLVGAMPYVDAYVSYDIRNRKLAVKLKQSCNFPTARIVGSLEELSAQTV